jgi:hypothetical protein
VYVGNSLCYQQCSEISAHCRVPARCTNVLGSDRTTDSWRGELKAQTKQPR